MDDRVHIIAEAGVNHNGDRELALDLIRAAKDAGADAVKFQTAQAEKVVVDSAPKAAYQKTTTDSSESQIDMLRRILLPYDAFYSLVEECRALNIDFLSTPFDLESLDFLVNDLRVNRLKIPSGEMTNGPLLWAAGRSGLDIVMSTGMCTLGEIQDALSIVSMGYAGQGTVPDGDLPAPDVAAIAGKISLLQCTTEYPAPIGETNLRAMDTLRDRFGIAVGFSDHTDGIFAAVAAAARGASIIEKHFTLDRSLPGPDHKASLEPDQLAEMVKGIRHASKALGASEKIPSASEKPNMAIARKSLVATKDIAAGEIFTLENLGAKRPGTGISPMKYWQYLGRSAVRNISAGELIDQ